MISVGQQLAGLSSKAKAARVIPSTVHIYKPFHVCLCKVSLVFCTTLPALYRQSSRRLVSSALKYLPSSKKKKLLFTQTYLHRAYHHCLMLLVGQAVSAAFSHTLLRTCLRLWMNYHWGLALLHLSLTIPSLMRSKFSFKL